MTDRREFLASFTATLAAAGVSGKLTNEKEHTVTHDCTMIMRERCRDGSYNEHRVPLQREVATDLKGFEELGISEEDVIALATSALLLRAQGKARQMLRESLEGGVMNSIAEAQAQHVFASYTPCLRHPRSFYKRGA